MLISVFVDSASLGFSWLSRSVRYGMQPLSVLRISKSCHPIFCSLCIHPKASGVRIQAFNLLWQTMCSASMSFAPSYLSEAWWTDSDVTDQAVEEHGCVIRTTTAATLARGRLRTKNVSMHPPWAAVAIPRHFSTVVAESTTACSTIYECCQHISSRVLKEGLFHRPISGQPAVRSIIWRQEGHLFHPSFAAKSSTSGTSNPPFLVHTPLSWYSSLQLAQVQASHSGHAAMLSLIFSGLIQAEHLGT